MNIAKICVFHVFLILLDQCYFGQYIENCLKPVKKMDAYHLQYTLDEDIKFEGKNVQNY